MLYSFLLLASFPSSCDQKVHEKSCALAIILDHEDGRQALDGEAQRWRCESLLSGALDYLLLTHFNGESVLAAL